MEKNANYFKKRIHIIDSAKETSTLDARHNQMIQSLQTSHQSISSVQKELSHLNDDISRIENQIKQFNEKTKELRDKRNNLEQIITNYASSNNLSGSVINISDGKLKIGN